MSYYHTETIDGYGICDADTPCNVTKERVETLLALAPKTSKRFHEAVGMTYSIEDLDDYEAATCAEIGVLSLLCDVMNEVEQADSLTDGVEFIAYEDDEDCKYVLYVPTYPWCMNEHEKRMISSGFIGELFHKYATILFGMPPIVDYYTCEYVRESYGV